MGNKMGTDFGLWRAYNLTQEVGKFLVGERQGAVGTPRKGDSSSQAGGRGVWGRLPGRV